MAPSSNQLHVKNYDISKTDAEKWLKPYLPLLCTIPLTAWKMWEELPDSKRTVLDARARACFVNNFMCHLARSIFEQPGSVKITDSRGIFLLGFADEVNLRLKKLSKQGKPRNVATTQQIDFSMQLELPGIPKLVRLTLGYILDPMQTHIIDIKIVHFCGQRFAWEFSIMHAKSSVVQMPLLPMEAQPRRVKVTAKDAKTAKKTGEK